MGRKIRKPAITVDKNRKPKTIKFGENPQTVQYTKTEKPQFLSAKTEKRNKKLAKSAKPQIPTPPSYKFFGFPDKLMTRSDPNSFSSSYLHHGYLRKNSFSPPCLLPLVLLRHPNRLRLKTCHDPSPHPRLLEEMGPHYMALPEKHFRAV